MQILLSPAKTLDFDSPPRTKLHTQPQFLKEAKELIALLNNYTPASFAKLMKVSPKLAALNCERHKAWQLPFTLDNAKQAVLAFKGAVYVGLGAKSFSKTDDTFAQNHLKILSGLYGLLLPFDLIQPYRLEMGTRLCTAKGAGLYLYWSKLITQALNKEKSRYLINLASEEYFKAIAQKELQLEVITPIFKEKRDSGYKVISFLAKKARGQMARYLIQNRCSSPEQICSFNWDGYWFDKEESTPSKLLFKRDQ